MFYWFLSFWLHYGSLWISSIIENIFYSFITHKTHYGGGATSISDGTFIFKWPAVMEIAWTQIIWSDCRWPDLPVWWSDSFKEVCREGIKRLLFGQFLPNIFPQNKSKFDLSDLCWLPHTVWKCQIKRWPDLRSPKMVMVASNDFSKLKTWQNYKKWKDKIIDIKWTGVSDRGFVNCCEWPLRFKTWRGGSDCRSWASFYTSKVCPSWMSDQLFWLSLRSTILINISSPIRGA